MPRTRVKIYRKRRPLRTFLWTLAILMVTTALLLLGSFFWFQNFIVHTTDGIRLDIPILRAFTEEIPASSVLPEPAPFLPEPTPTPQPTLPEPEVLPEGVYERVLHVPIAHLDTVLDWGETLSGFSATAVMIPLSVAEGYLWWDTSLPMAHSYLLAGEGRIDLTLDQIPNTVRRAALIHTFYNEHMSARNVPASLYGNWLDPHHPDIIAYITDQAQELVSLGFNEIVLRDFYPQVSADTPFDSSAVYTFLETLAQTLLAEGASLSLLLLESDWILDEGLDLSVLSQFVARFYTQLETETVQNQARFLTLSSRVDAVLGAGNDRFIPFAPGVTQDGNWMIYM